MNDAAKASLAGHTAARAGVPADRNPYGPQELARSPDGETSWLDLIWFNSWHLTKVEIEEKTKLIEHEVRNEEL